MKISIGRNGIDLGEWPAEEIRSFYQEGRLVDTDCYWTDGMTEWSPLARFIRPPHPFPATPSEQALSSAGPTPSTSPFLQPDPVPAEERQAHFRVRAAARMIDLFLWALVTTFFLIPLALVSGNVLNFNPTIHSSNQLEILSWVLFFTLTILGDISFIIGEIICLSLWGTSPGKLIFGLKIISADGGRFLPLKESFLRSFYLLANFGFMLFFPLNVALSGIKNRKPFLKSGTTFWDRKSGTVVIRKPMGNTRFKMGVLACILCSVGTLFYFKITFLETSFILHSKTPVALLIGFQQEAKSDAENSSSSQLLLTLPSQPYSLAPATPAGPATVVTDNAEAAGYRLSATAGDAVAARKLGLLYLKGQGVPQDLTQALNWLQRAANQGDAVAQYTLGNMYLNAQGISQDYSHAFSWYQKAANQGNANAQNDVGSMYLTGQGVAKDYSQAFKWYQKAANQGNPIAQYNIGGMYLKAQGVSRDYTRAFSWYQKAADQGESDAPYAIGFMYENGLGVTKDIPTAVKWYKKAAAHGNVSAQQWLQRSGH
jgi:TPR repeat protein/uncharacterized RDD family membrane protein YckC